MSGSDKLFYHLEPLIIEQIDQVKPRDLGHLAYAYSVRSVGNPELYAAIDKRLERLIDENGKTSFDYPTLFDLNYYMIFRESKNEKIWKAIIESTVAQDDVLPITYYKPFKFSRFYLQHHFPQWDITAYVDKFWYAE